MYEADLSFLHYSPTRLVFGEGQVAEAELELERLGGARAILVTDRFLREHTPVVSAVVDALGSRLAGVFDGVTPDAEVGSIEAAAARAKEIDADCVVSVGGGSAMDTGKGVALLLARGGSLLDYQGFQNLGAAVAPHVAIPTTAGTGSEVSYAFLARSPADHRKLIFADYHLIPPAAILDPELTVGLPPRLTAATALDTLTHGIESMHSLQRHPVADALAKEAIYLVGRHLPEALADGSDLVARGQLLIAASIAGIAFSSAQVGLVHAMAHSLGARHGLHHGAANAICLPHVIRFNAEACPSQYAAAARAFGLPPTGRGDVADSLAFADAIESFVAESGIPTRLSEEGLTAADLPGCAAQTLEDGSIVYNPRFALDIELVHEVFRRAL